jgi:hypothetical protein
MKENDFSRFKVIDAHFHYSKIASFMSGAEKNGTDYSRTGWLKDCGENSVVAGLCMGVTETNSWRISGQRNTHAYEF